MNEIKLIQIISTLILVQEFDEPLMFDTFLEKPLDEFVKCKNFYLGYANRFPMQLNLTDRRICDSLGQIKTAEESPKQTNKPKLEGFVGHCSYYGRFVTITQHLWKEKTFHLDLRRSRFQFPKKPLTTVPFLAYRRDKGLSIFASDGSQDTAVKVSSLQKEITLL